MGETEAGGKSHWPGSHDHDLKTGVFHFAWGSALDLALLQGKEGAQKKD